MIGGDQGGLGDRIGYWLGGWKSMENGKRITMGGKSRGEVRGEIG